MKMANRLVTTNAVLVGVALLGMLSFAGCGPSYTALAPGKTMPALQVGGWVNGQEPGDLDGKVVVIQAFATW